MSPWSPEYLTPHSPSFKGGFSPPTPHPLTHPFPPPSLPQVPASAFEPNATNPLGMDPMLLASSFYAALAMESDCDYDGDGCDLFPTGEIPIIASGKAEKRRTGGAEIPSMLRYCREASWA